MTHNKNIMAALPLLATVLGDKYGVQVHIGGDRACTDGNIIYLPDIPLDCDADFATQVRGFIDHESAHIRYTDFEALAQAKLNPVQKHLWNALEDWRVENALAKIFPGCKGNFHRLIEEHFAREKHTQNTEKAGKNPAFSLLNYVLLTVRSWDVPSIEVQRRKEAVIIERHFPHLLQAIDTVLINVQKHCQSTHDSIAYALELYQAIKSYAQDLFNNNPQKPSKEKGENTQENIQKMLQSNTEDLPSGLGECLAKNLEGKKEHSQRHTLAVAIEGHRSCASFAPHVLEEIRRSSTALRTRLHGLLQASVQQPCVLGQRGKIYPAKLHNLSTHNPRVFLRSGQKKSVSTAVHVLLDCSGSMDGPRMELAGKACYGVALALEQCQGVNVGVTAFPASTASKNPNAEGVFPVVKHGQRVHPRFAIKARGCTPLTESLWWVMQQMYVLKEERKIILIISDGVPDSLYTTKHALTHSHKLGFEVLALGVEDNSLEMLLPETSRTIHDLNTLPSALFSMLQQALLKQ